MVETVISHLCPGAGDDCGERKEGELSQAEHSVLEATVWRKLDRRILPLCASFFLLLAVDTSNIGNARVAGLQTSLAMTNRQFSLVLTASPYIVSQFVPTLLLKYVGPDLILPAMMTLGGVVSGCQGFVVNYSGLLACRFFLGFVQGGLPSCIILYLSFFYPRKRLQMRIATFFTSASLAGAFSGCLAAGIYQLNGKGGKPGWGWIFILEGGFAIVFGVVSFFLLPRSPDTARFLTDKERAYVVSVLKRAGSISEDDSKDNFTWAEVVATAKSPHVWLLTINSFLGGTILIGLVFFEPTIVAGLGYEGTTAQLMTVPPFALTFVLTRKVSLISAFVSDRYQCRGFIAIAFSLMEVIGSTMFYVSRSNRVRYISIFFSAIGALCTIPPLGTWLANNSAPHARRATAVAMTSITGQAGAILAMWLLGSLSTAPDYTLATATFIIMSIFMVILAASNLVFLWRENRLKAVRRQMMRKEEEPEGLGDRSAWFIYSL